MSGRASFHFTPFNRPARTGLEERYLAEVFERGKFAGGGPFSERCNSWLRDHFGAPAALVATSCTHALEMAAILANVGPRDEVILPSYAFSSTANAFLRCGARLVFVDIEPKTMNIDPEAAARAVTPDTKILVALHYAGVGCDMDALADLARRCGLIIVEDAAQAIFADYDERPCGSFGTFGCLSFHESKNLHCGEGGALIVNDPAYVERAEIVLEKGTNRAGFFRGDVDKYTWQDIGSSYVLSELNAAFLLAQLENGLSITSDRLRNWSAYYALLRPLADSGLIDIPEPPSRCGHNGHIFWIKVKDQHEQGSLISFLKRESIHAVFHYVPLHSSPAGRRYGRFVGEDRYTTKESERLVRLPLFYGFRETERVAHAITTFYEKLTS